MSCSFQGRTQRKSHKDLWRSHLAMGQNPVPPVNIPIPTKIGSEMGGALTPKWDPIGFDPRDSVASAHLQNHWPPPTKKTKNTCSCRSRGNEQLCTIWSHAHTAEWTMLLVGTLPPTLPWHLTEGPFRSPKDLPGTQQVLC